MSVQLTITSISHTHAPLQLCSITPNHNGDLERYYITISDNDDTDGEHNNEVTIQWCLGVANIHVLVIISFTCRLALSL